jgi:predicted esterase
MSKLLAPSFLLCTVLLLPRAAHAVEFQFDDPDGLPAYGYAPTAKPTAGKTYWLVVGVHGVGGDGQLAAGAAKLASQFDDVLVLGPTFIDAGVVARKAQRPTEIQDYYQVAGPEHTAKLDALIEQVGKVWPTHPKVILHGYSGGSQFVCHYAMAHPDKIAGVAAHSGGSWMTLDGDEKKIGDFTLSEKINPAAKSIPFVVSCGEADVEFSSKASKLNRINGARKFAADLKSLEFDVDLKTWPRQGHVFTPGAYEQTKALVAKIRDPEGAKANEKKPGAKGPAKK